MTDKHIRIDLPINRPKPEPQPPEVVTPEPQRPEVVKPEAQPQEWVKPFRRK